MGYGVGRRVRHGMCTVLAEGRKHTTVELVTALLDRGRLRVLFSMGFRHSARQKWSKGEHLVLKWQEYGTTLVVALQVFARGIRSDGCSLHTSQRLVSEEQNGTAALSCLLDSISKVRNCIQKARCRTSSSRIIKDILPLH